MATESVVWIDPDGAQTPLRIGLNSQQGDMVGRFMPPVQHTDDQLPFTDGSVHRQTVFNERQFGLPINVLGTSQTDLRTKVRALVHAMNPKRGSGVIRVTSPLGDVRDIDCRYVSGLDLNENVDKGGRNGQSAIVTFKANDPFWHDTGDTVQSWQIVTVPTFFPIFPLRLTSSSIVVADIVVNSGDTEMWPIWTITGPGGGAGGISLINVTTGQMLAFETTLLGLGEFITIDTKLKTVTLNDGTNLFGDLDPLSVLWPFVEGSNTINLVLNSATPGTSLLSASYRQRYLSP